MLKNLSTRKALSLILCLMMVLSTVFTGFSVSAEEATEEVIAINPTITDLSKTKNNDGNDIFNNYSSVDFDGLGKNLVPDSTVADFNEDGTYKDYNAETNEGWWAKDSVIGGTMNLKTSGLLTNDTAQSHTADGSGAILPFDGGQWSFTKMPLPAMEAEKYYVITLWIHRTDTSNQGHASKIVYYGTNADGSDGEFLVHEAWMNGTHNSWFRASFIIYTGTAAQNNSNLSIMNGMAAFDELAVYEVSAEFAEKCITDKVLFNAKDLRDATHSFKDVTGKGSSINYKDIDFAKLGDNIITDSTVAYFDEDGQYKKYYNYDVEEGEYILNGGYPDVVDTNAFWGKAANNWQAFYGDANSFGIPADLGYTDSTTSLSHTADGSGVIKLSGRQSIYLPMPTLEYKEYYLVTFWIKADANEDVATRFHSSLWDTSSQMGTAVTPEWKRATYIWYVGKTADRTEALFDFYHGNDANTLYIDDFEVYKLDAAYGAECMAAGYLISDKDRLPAEDKYLPITFNAEGKAIDYSEVDFSQYGKNLYPDSTVSHFNEDGTYKTYDSTTKEGWFNQVALGGQAETSMWGNLVTLGYISDNTALSHTADGSGVISATQGWNLTIPSISLAKKTYYLYTAWVKFEGKDAELRFYYPDYQQNSHGNYSQFGDTEWHRVSYIIYTGDVSMTPHLGFFTGYAGYVDDIAIYELDYEYGKACYNLGRLKTEKDDRPDDTAFELVVDSNIWSVHMPSFGENLVADSDVSYFDESGNYKPYYDNETINAGANGQAYNVIDTNATWAQVANVWQYYYANTMIYGSMKNRGLIDNTFTHNNDGTGSLKVTDAAYLPLPSLTSTNDYYLVSYWVYAKESMSLVTKYFDNSLIELIGTSFTLNKGWNRVAQVVYVGDKAYTPVLYLNTENKDVYVDDIGVYKLDYEYGKQAVAEKKLPNNREAVAGDVNCDNVVDMKDLIRIKKLVAGITDNALRLNADIVGGGEVDAQDIAKLVQILLAK